MFAPRSRLTTRRVMRVGVVLVLLLMLLSTLRAVRAQEGEDSSSTADEEGSSTGDDISTGEDSSTGDDFSTGDDISTGDDGSTLDAGTGDDGSSSADPFDSSSTGLFNDSSSSSSSTGRAGGGVVDSSTSTKPDDEPNIPPGGTIGKGDSSFGSTDAVFLTEVRDVWLGIILWTMIFTAAGFFIAGVHAVRVCGNVWRTWLWLPPLTAILGAGVGFVHGVISAALVAAIARAIPYPVGIDIAAGLGIGQAICITYFHLGRADFIHR